MSSLEITNSMLPDIYFLPEWGDHYAARDKGKAERFNFVHEFGHIYYQFVKKPVPFILENTQYYDIVTPYGFSGPIILSYVDNKKQALCEAFNIAFSEYCMSNNIVAEYVRFNPWLKNQEDFKDFYSLTYRCKTVYVDLTTKDFVMDEFHHTTRKHLQKAFHSDFTVKFDYTGETVDEFIDIYQFTVNKNHLEKSYQFDEDFIRNSFKNLSNNQFIMTAYRRDIPIASSISLHHGSYVHGHLLGINPDFYKMGISSLLYYEVSKWGVENGKTHFHVGGANTEGLMSYKKKLTKNGFCDYYTGTRIRSNEIYDSLAQIAKKNKANLDESFFPIYRG